VTSAKFKAIAAVALFAGHGICCAQSAGAAAAQPNPMDMRIGAVRQLESPDNLTDGGIRTAPTRQSMPIPAAAIGKDYVVSPNDLIDVEVFDADNLKRTVRVNAAGAISLPLIGQVSVGGLTASEVEQRIAQRYGEKYLQNPQVSIFIREFTSERITVEGAVGRPGIFPLSGKLTLLRVLALAGGFGPIADSSKVMLYRVNDSNQREAFVYDVEKIRAGKSEDPSIKGDDLIVVQRDSTRVLLKDSLFRDVIDSVNPFSVLAR
jgi:polysaccharide biosynthesis/export protein